MSGARFIGSVRRTDWLGKPVDFSQSTTFNPNKTWQFSNRLIEVEYQYDITFETNRDISQKEYGEMRNALHSAILVYGDKASDGLSLWSRVYHSSAKMVELMQGGDISIDYFAKRYVLGNGKDIGFVSDYEVFVDKNQEKNLAL